MLATAAQQLQSAMQQHSTNAHKLQQDHQAALQERDALRQKHKQQNTALESSAATIQQLQEAAADLADDLQSARSAAGRHVGQHTALRELSVQHDACMAQLAAKATAVDELNASMTHLRAELEASTAQKAQHDQDSTEQQAEFMGRVLKELQVLEAALVQKGEECESVAQQNAKLKAESDGQLEAHISERDAQTATVQQLRRDLNTQRAQHGDLTEKLLALEAQVAYKQHKQDALLKELADVHLSRAALQDGLHKQHQQAASSRQQLQTAEASTWTSNQQAGQSSDQGTQTSAVDADHGGPLQGLQQQLASASEQHEEYRRSQQQLTLEVGSKLQAELQAGRAKHKQLEAAAAALKASKACIDSLQGEIAGLQAKLQASTAQSCSLQQLLQDASTELDALSSMRQQLDALQQALHNSQPAAVDLQQQLTAAEEGVAAAQARQQELVQQASASLAERQDLLTTSAADQKLLHELKLELAAAQEDRAALLAVPQPDATAALKLQQTQQSVHDLQARLVDQGNSLQNAQAAAEAAAARNNQTLSQLAEAQQAVKLTEQMVNELTADLQRQLAIQEQLQQDRDSLMEEVLSAKARAAEQERTIQSLRVAADATAREKKLLIDQLDSTEQQLGSQAQELLQQQGETQRLQAAHRDQAAYLKKAQLKGSSNEHGLRGMQQRLQEALQDTKAAELKEQSMHSRLQEGEQAASQARQQIKVLAAKLDDMHLQMATGGPIDRCKSAEVNQIVIAD